MRKFDVEKFLNAYKIPYITKGVNVKRGEWNVSCPFCNETSTPDPSFHLGIQLDTGKWSCWRNRRRHKGSTLHRLLMKLAHISYGEVCRLLNDGQVWLGEGSFEALASDPAAIFGASVNVIEPEVLDLPDNFQQFDPFYPSSRLFFAYLEHRGFENVQELAELYGLRYCISDFDGGKWQNRVILPIFIDYTLQTWTGRSILREPRLRYNTLSTKSGALIPITDAIFNFDGLLAEGSKKETLFLCEGPFDALKFDFYARNAGGRATCLFGLNMGQAQLGLISELSQIFGKLVVLLDTAEVNTSMSIRSQLSFLPIKVVEGSLPVGVKDPGDLTELQVLQLVHQFARFQ